MGRRAPQPQPPTVPLGEAVTTEHLKAAVEAGVGPIKAEMRWQRAIIFALAAVVFGPHIPAAPALATISALADPNALTHAALAVRASLHV